MKKKETKSMPVLKISVNILLIIYFSILWYENKKREIYLVTTFSIDYI